MPIYVDIISRLDERAAAVAAKNIEREMAAAGARGGSAAGRAIGENVTKEAAAAGRNAGEQLSREVDRATKAAGSRIVDGFAANGASAGKAFSSSLDRALVSRLNDRAADVAAGRLVSKLSAAGTASGAAFSKALQAEAQRSSISVDRLRSSLVQQLGVTPGQSAGRSFGGAFGSSLVSSLPVAGRFSSALSGYEGAASKAGALAGRALGTAFTAAATGIIGAAGVALFKGFDRYKSLDATSHRLAAMGNSAEQVKTIMSDINEVVVGTPIALDEAAKAATQFLAGGVKQGRPLQAALTAIADAAGASGQKFGDLAVIFNQVFNKGKLQAEEMLQLNERGINVQAALQKEFGLTSAEIQKMSQDGTISFGMLVQAIEGQFGGMSKKLADTVDGALSNMNAAVGRVGANFISALFGDPLDTTEGPGALAKSINNVTDKLNDLNAWIVAHKDDIKDAFEGAVETAQDLWDALSSVVEMLDRIGISVGDVVTAFMAWKAIAGVTALTQSLSTVSTTLAGLPATADKSAKGISAALSRVAVPAWLAFLVAQNGPEIEQAIQNAIPGADSWNHSNTPDQLGRRAREWWDRNIQGGTGVDPQPSPLPQLGGGSGPGTPTVGGIPIPGLVGPNSNGPASPFGNLPGQVPLDVSVEDRRGRRGGGGAAAADAGPDGPLADLFPGAAGSADGSSSGPKLPDAPVLPYDTTLPPGIPGMPQDAAVFSAESSYLDARHKLAEKRARAAQLEQSTEATEEDRLKARNDVIEAERDLQAAEMRMSDARANQYEKLTKQTDQHAKDLGQIGAQLDQDFGISKGLAGIAENITKFVANLAAAPLLGQLQAISAYNPTQGGHGLMGVLGAQGVFGPQYQNNQYAGRGSYPSAGATGVSMTPIGAYPGDAALLANVPAGRYTQEQRGDLTQGLADCSSAVEDLVNLMDGRPTTGASMSTHNADEWLTARGFVKGMGGPGDFRVAFNPSHMQATLPGGTPFNWGSASAAARRGIGGTGADDPSLTSRYYRPVTSVPGGSAASAAAPGLYSPQNTDPALNNPTAPVSSGAWAPNPAPLPTTGGGGGPMAAGAPQGLFTGGPTNTTNIGANVAPYAGSGSGGIGMDGGGALGMAVQAGGMALDAMAPGAGQAAQTGVKLINRAIEYGGQVAAIGAQGLMETFLPTGGSDLANNNWITRIAGGLAGAAPALPNLAGQASQQRKDIDPQAAAQGQVQPKQGGDTNITVNNQRATEDGTGRDIAYHLQNQYVMPGG
ncbi:tape measure protein [Mycobacterium phage Modragons]|uniref:Tape measure protein n=1 Tax=Mycobacterium phage Ochi17 TaxID=2502425 RepID=A0A411BTC9_9CAUD|nr:tail length tape measure protein [Mycobacterium phage Llama]YP_010101028.1 tail length tape measure protein [Mycobacterium phage Ochi17]QFP96398.1 tape measure protein [Mycobacterium phage Modragons]QOP67097.1 tape measure protein [Mycobacterium phage Seabastian]QOP67208.1 tape measure protein [Mycobacterium phage OfUltron]WNM64834.1 tape measure protein [Mycobacterium phage AlpineSix]AIM50956.1 tape measure protein [Mycobacterium phage Llama]